VYDVGDMNPFGYQGPVDPHRLIDRRSELDELQRAAANRVAIRLAAPRRFGKSSVLAAHADAMRVAGHRAVTVDLSKVTSVGDAAARVAQAYARLPADPGRTARRWLARLGAEVRVPGFGLRVQPDARIPAQDARAALLELLDVPLALHGGDGGLTVVCLDEFQDVLVADDQLDGLLRSRIQHHGAAAAYVYAGSEPSLMRALFSDRERPFYGQARPLELPPLPAADAAADIAELMREHGVEPGDEVDRLLAVTAGHPQRTMLVAHHLFDVLDGPPGDAPPLETAVDRALAETRDVHQAVWDGLGRVERIVLAAVASGQAPTGSRLAAEHRIARSTLAAATDRLLRDGTHLTKVDGRPWVLDPLLALWLRGR
jgi:hypothetical protein